MCGINGIALSSRSDKQINEQILRRMTDVIFHRGPDDGGIFIDEKIGFGHRRLSIVDVAHGAQPMFNEDRSKVIIYNGEIYNFRELRAEIPANYLWGVFSPTLGCGVGACSACMVKTKDGLHMVCTEGAALDFSKLSWGT